jgi:uncharacterized protein GlcG (DUF336 family)
MSEMKLTFEKATEIVAGAIAQARSAGVLPVTVVVLDESGQLKAAGRDDGASMFRFDVALGKAFAAVGMGVPSRTLAQRAQENPNFFVALAATGQGKFLPQPGAVLIRNAAGELLGAAGASGGTGDEDEAACAAGVAAAGLMSDPSYE